MLFPKVGISPNHEVSYLDITDITDIPASRNIFFSMAAAVDPTMTYPVRRILGSVMNHLSMSLTIIVTTIYYS